MNAIAWRYRNAFEELSFLRGHYSQKNAPVDHEDHYQREKSLFGFFTAGVSCIEATLYAIAAYTSVVPSFDFSEKAQRACNPSKLYEWLKPHVGAVGLAVKVEELSKSSEWEFLLEVRNCLSHRGNLPGIIQLSAAASLPKVKPILFDRTTSTDERNTIRS